MNRAGRSRGSRYRGHALYRGDPRRFRSSGLAAWYRADQGITIATGVSQWNDISGNARHLAQAAGAKQPLFVASAANGKPGVRTDGSDDFIGPVSFTLNQPYTVILAMKLITAGGGGTNDVAVDGGIAASCAIITDNITHYYLYAGGVVSVGAGNDPSTGVYHVLTHTFDTTASTIYVDAALKGGPGNVGVSVPTGVTLGSLADGTRPSNNEFAEAVFISAAMNASARARIQHYMAALYGVVA